MTDSSIWMPLYIGDYLADTQLLSTEQHGAYLLLIMAYWKNQGPLPNDEAILMSVCKLQPARWKLCKPALMKYFVIVDGYIVHGRINEEIERCKKRSKQGSTGGESRWDSDTGQKGRQLRSQRMAEARQKGTHNAAQWESMKGFHGFKCCRCGSGGEIVKDHITPIYQGGSDGIENIQPLCRSCNASKGPDGKDLRTKGWEVAYENACTEGNYEGNFDGNKCLQNAKPMPGSHSHSHITTPVPEESFLNFDPLTGELAQ